MSSYKQLYKHLINASDTFSLIELTAIDSALSWYIDSLKKHPDCTTDVKLQGEIEAAASALKKIQLLYKQAHGPHI